MSKVCFVQTNLHDIPDGYITTKQATLKYNVSTSTLYRWRQAGELRWVEGRSSGVVWVNDLDIASKLGAFILHEPIVDCE